MATPDHLFNLRNNFYLGAYQAAINSSDINGLYQDDVVERDILVHRCYIALGQLQLVNSEINDSAPTPLQAAKLLALYFSSPDAKESAISSLKEWLADPAIGNNSTLRLVVGIVFLCEQDINEALKYTNHGTVKTFFFLGYMMFSLDEDGQTCFHKPVFICSSHSFAKNEDMANATEIVGAVRCICPDGYVGDGFAKGT